MDNKKANCPTCGAQAAIRLHRRQMKKIEWVRDNCGLDWDAKATLNDFIKMLREQMRKFEGGNENANR